MPATVGTGVRAFELGTSIVPNPRQAAAHAFAAAAKGIGDMHDSLTTGQGSEDQWNFGMQVTEDIWNGVRQ